MSFFYVVWKNLGDSFCLVLGVVERISRTPYLVFEVVWMSLCKSHIPDFWNGLKNLGDFLCMVFKMIWRNLWDSLCLVFEVLWNNLAHLLYLIFKVVWKNLWDSLCIVWKNLGNHLCPVFEVVWKNPRAPSILVLSSLKTSQTLWAWFLN